MIFTLFKSGGTEKAHLFMFCQKQTAQMKASEKLGIWIPKSCCKVIEMAPDKVGQWNECKVDVANWYVARHALQVRQQHVHTHHVKI